MNKIVKQILKNAGVKAQVTSNQSVPKFRVNEGLLRLEGVVTTGKYSMTIKDVKGKSIDSLSVTIKDSNELANSIVTGKQIGRASCRERVLRLV